MFEKYDLIKQQTNFKEAKTEEKTFGQSKTNDQQLFRKRKPKQSRFNNMV